MTEPSEAQVLSEVLASPVVQAPMAGGASGPALVAAVSEAGVTGFLAAGYKPAARMREEIERTRKATSRPFGMNLFMPSHDRVDEAAVAAYRERLVPEAERLGVELGAAGDRSDDWDAKIADLLADPPAIVGFTFGCPDPEVLAAFREKGVITIVTVTSVPEAHTATVAGAGALCVQGKEAGGHSGTFTDAGDTPLRELLPAVRAATDLPLLAAGGLATGAHVAEALALGADAAQLGTAFLRCPESGASAVHKAALADPRFTETAMTRAFSGRFARGLVNRFMSEHSAYAPVAYPDVHYLTAPLRKAAAARGDADAVNLWAGESFRLAVDAPAAEVAARLLDELAAAAQ
ncbi:NAD(P)H-dependent flavin oxidoreductase [Spirillospora sp. NPDC048911]|uniref:NAD(P)H-dependent flavin oxidoreductase n=1 Tax=Spirillospora sp. NPDC048911 TaxID=3364527 RepID=UPI00371CA74E